MIAESPITWSTRLVDGHQDDDINATLDWWARQYIQIDNLVKVFWMNHLHLAPVQYSISHEGFQVWLGNHKLSSRPSSAFFDHINGKTILAWHTTHHCIPACYARRIDWAVCAAALKRLPMGHRLWVSKHISGFCSVGTKMLKWGEQPRSDYPRCGLPENARHVWLCQEPAVYFVWALLMSSFST
jgi:hypothetical protein